MSVLDGYDRFIGKATPKGLVLKALAKNGATLATYFVRMTGGEPDAGPRRLPGFDAVTDSEEATTVMFFARRSFNRLTSGDIAQWDQPA